MDASSTANHTFSPGKTYQLFLGGEWIEGKTYVDIHFPYDRAVLVGRVAWADRQNAETAITRAQEGAQTMAAMPAHRRASMLHRVAELIAARAAYFADLIVYEVGKPILRFLHLSFCVSVLP